MEPGSTSAPPAPAAEASGSGTAAGSAAAAELLVKWQNQEFRVALQPDDTVAVLKRHLEAETRVSSKRQKLLGLKSTGGKMATDDTRIGDLVLKAGAKIMLMGSPEEQIAAVAAQEEAAPEVQVRRG